MGSGPKLSDVSRTWTSMACMATKVELDPTPPAAAATGPVTDLNGLHGEDARDEAATASQIDLSAADPG